MDADATDVSRTVEYSRDKWIMNRVPWALAGCAAGLAFVAFLDPGPPSLKALVLLGLLFVVGLIVGLSSYVLDRLFDSMSTAAVWGVVLLGGGALIYFFGVPSKSRSTFLSTGESAGLPGWLIIYLCVGWIAYALFRHFSPAKPMLMLSPAGITCQTPCLRTVLIPWREIKDVGGLEYTGAYGPPNRFPDTTVVVISNEFYERHLVPRRKFAPSGSWESMFPPKGALMQMVLPHFLWFGIEPKDIRQPVEARWKAFRDQQEPATSVPRTTTEPDPHTPAQIYGRWTFNRSPWQAIAFLVPTLAIIAIVVTWISAPPRDVCAEAFAACLRVCNGETCQGLCEKGKQACATTGQICLPNGWCHPRRR